MPRQQPAARVLHPVALLLMVSVLLAMGVIAWESAVFPRAAHAQSQDTIDIDILEQDAQPDFPYEITFSLAAESSDLPITEAELLYGAARSETLTIVPVDITPGQQVNAEHVLDTQIFHLPVGVTLSYRWILRDEAGNEMETSPQELVYHDERFAWQERTERNVTVYWYEGGDSFGDELIETSTRTLNRLEEEIGATVEEPVKIYIYANPLDMRSALQSNEVEWVGGQAVPGLGLIIAAIAPGDTSEVQRIVPHELSHQVLYQAIDNPYGGMPLWFEEGLAVYNQETTDAIFPVMIEEAARTDQLIPLEALASSFPADPQRALLSYAQSHSMVAYIVDTYGTEKLAELVDAFNQAMPADEAVPAVLDLSVDELDAAWRETLPPAEVTAPRVGSPDVAPADRFEGDPVLPPDTLAPAAPTPTALPPAQAPQQPDADMGDIDGVDEMEPEAPSLLPGLALPLWVELGLVGMGCMVTIVVVGAALFVTLRLAKVGSQE